MQHDNNHLPGPSSLDTDSNGTSLAAQADSASELRDNPEATSNNSDSSVPAQQTSSSRPSTDQNLLSSRSGEDSQNAIEQQSTIDLSVFESNVNHDLLPAGKHDSPLLSMILGRSLDSSWDIEQFDITDAVSETSGPTKKRDRLARHLNPLSELSDIFQDMVSNIPQSVKETLRRLGGHTLNIGTMCSGTESPILALDMINEALERHSLPQIRYQHALSCELQPQKQAYIERNFHPQYLFRDVEELSGKKALTAYGGRVDVPGDLDILIAGSSCVDFSNLNANREKVKQKAEGEGESYKTLLGIMDYCKRYRPKIVLTENVANAPWTDITRYWADRDYHMLHMKIDTQNYYLPQTRNRGYSIVIRQDLRETFGLSPVEVASNWKQHMKNFERRASSPFTDFIFQEDDQRLLEAKLELSVSQFSSKNSVDWDKCRTRYLNYRVANQLGFLRPLTKWKTNGSCSFPDGSWMDWSRSQVERLWDTIDIRHLESIRLGKFDISFKSRSLNLSQNVDRESETRSWGLVGCITPSGCPYLTTRNGPMVGLESLALQGIPIERLNLTTETSKFLQDLAGNAMSSTVIGASILSALGCSRKILADGRPLIPLSKIAAPLGGHQHEKTIGLPGTLENILKVQLGRVDDLALEEFSKLALSTLRLCACESSDGRQSGPFQGCIECSHTTCLKCGINPVHFYRQIPSAALEQRKYPAEFEQRVREGFPLQLQISALQSAFEFELSSITWSQSDHNVVDAIQASISDCCPLSLSEVRRTRSWIIIYENSSARLELSFRFPHNLGDLFDISQSNELLDLDLSGCAQWHLFAKPNPDLSQDSEARKILSSSIARMTCHQALFEGHWELRLPQSTVFTLKIDRTKQSKKVDSWEKRQGLKQPDPSHMWSHLSVTSSDGLGDVPSEILGEYKFLPDCGTACGSLYRMISPKRENLTPLFLFLDPRPLEDATEDRLVFAQEHERLLNGRSRDVVATLKRGWRLNAEQTGDFVLSEVPGKWKLCKFKVDLRLPNSSEIKISTSAIPNPSKFGCDSCGSSNMLKLDCQIPTKPLHKIPWIAGKKYVLDLIDQPAALQPLAKLAQRIGHTIDGQISLAGSRLDVSISVCKKCAPPKAPFVYGGARDVDEEKVTIRDQVIEDYKLALQYEQGMKARPSPVTGWLCRNEHTITIRAELNFVTLIHRAHAKLSSHQLDPVESGFHVEWDLKKDLGLAQPVRFPHLSIQNTKNEVDADQPPSFEENEQELNDSQIKSLTWMLNQESGKANGWFEQEIEEARIPSLDLRLEAIVKLDKNVCGGVLADEPGYGKTATTLGLFDADARNISAQFRQLGTEDAKDALSIPLKATIIFVPCNLISQWEREKRTFLGAKHETLVIPTFQKLKGISLEAFQGADLILTTWNIFSDGYFEELGRCLPKEKLPATLGRAFEEWLDQAVSCLRGSHRFPKRSSNSSNPSGQDESNPDAGCSTSNNGSTIVNARKRSAQKGFAEPAKKRLKAIVSETLLYHVFDFYRIVIDEFTYATGKPIEALMRLSSKRKWLLSGTPDLSNFASIHQMARLLGTSISNDEDNGGIFEGQQNLKKKLAYKTGKRSLAISALIDTDVSSTATEQFDYHSFQTRRSPSWYNKRYAHCHRFVKKFVRQNPADISKLKRIDHFEVVNLPAVEYVTYFELLQMVTSEPLKFGQSEQQSSSPNDRAGRLRASALACASAEHALLACCSSAMSKHAIDSAKSDATARDVCLEMCNERAALCANRCDALIILLERAFRWFAKHGNTGKTQNAKLQDRTYYNTFIRTASGVSEERHARTLFLVALKYAWDQSLKSGRKEHEPAESKGRARIQTMTGEVASITMEITQHIQALRLFQTIRALVEHREAPTCSNCGYGCSIYDGNAVIMGLCGHVSCGRCLQHKLSQNPRSCDCIAKDCSMAARAQFTIKFNDIVPQGLDPDPPILEFGSKLEAVIELLQDTRRIKNEDHVLIFFQIDCVKKDLIRALEKHSVAFTDSDHTHGPMRVENFKAGNGGQVCLLRFDSVNAAGWNLQIANHIIFVSSLITRTQYGYDSSFSQAVGRALRRGQEKAVSIYHFLAAKTIDVNILQDRTRKVFVERDGKIDLVSSDEILETDSLTQLEGAKFEGARDADEVTEELDDEEA